MELNGNHEIAGRKRPLPRRPDPRSRAVVKSTPLKAGSIELELECGHRVRRKFAFCAPERLICPECTLPAT
ncbi:MAG: hypothetical protein ACM3YM_09430 [Sphingomonadales bacterium]